MMKVCNTAANGQAQAGTRLVLIRQTIKAVEYLVSLRGVNARAIIANRHHQTCFTAADLHADMPTCGGVMDRVIDEVAQQRR